MAERYDAVIIGGGHNGLVSAAYLARAGMKTLVLEQRHVLGGAAVTEELFPGFRFSVFSYVVSLLRPEIIRELQLPRHGLDILPLDGTFTPLRQRRAEGRRRADVAGTGDYLWRVNDHGRTIRELRRWSASDAEAYEEYGQLMVEMARFIKPILGDHAARPDLARSAPAAAARRPPPELPAAAGAPAGRLRPADDDVRRGLPRPVVRDGPAQGDDERVGDHRDVPRGPLAGHGVRPAPPLHGRDRRRVPRLGHPEGRDRRDLERDRQSRRGPSAPRSGPRRRSSGSSSKDGRAVGVVLAGSGEEIRRRRRPLVGGRAPDVPRAPRAGHARRRVRGGDPPVQVPRLARARSTWRSIGCPSSRACPGAGEHLRGAISFSPSVDEMEQAYDDAKYGRFSRSRTST